MGTTTFTVSGMTCGGCVKRVRSAISEVDGVTGVDVKFKGGLVTVTSEDALDAEHGQGRRRRSRLRGHVMNVM